MGMNIAKPRISTALVSANFVFVRREWHPICRPLQGSLRTEKYFTLEVGVREDKKSVDWLKVAVVDKELHVQVNQTLKQGQPSVKN